MNPANEIRNRLIVLMRKLDGDYFGWGKIGNAVGIGRQFAKDVYTRDKDKYYTNLSSSDKEQLLKLLDLPKK